MRDCTNADVVHLDILLTSNVHTVNIHNYSGVITYVQPLILVTFVAKMVKSTV